MLDTLLAVSRGFKTRFTKPDTHTLCSSMFQVVLLGYCQITVTLVLREALPAPRRKRGAAVIGRASAAEPRSAASSEQDRQAREAA
jgi:hypothetical protein